MLMISCEQKEKGTQNKPADGVWRGVIHLQGEELPFNFQIHERDSLKEIILINGDERISIDEISMKNDSIYIPMHIFDTRIVSRYSKTRLKGYWQKNYIENYILPFTGEHNLVYRFSKEPESPYRNISGRWEVYFLTEADSSRAVGVFNQQGNYLDGTFLKSTGDYRFLAGEVDGDSLKLSTFDGEHAYLFKAKITDDNSIYGTFWSGKSWKQPWYAIRNEEASLPDLSSLTYLKQGYDRVYFQLPDLDGTMISLDDSKYREKVVIVQIFGTWCPNCLDETRFLADWYRKNRHREIEIVALAFERKADLNYARERITRMKEKYDIDYDFLFAGKADKEEAARVLPMLNRIVSFPTTIFIDRKGNVRNIHTGFNGPGTGDLYEKFIDEFNHSIDKLLQE